MKNKYRILEYKNHFTIERQYEEVENWFFWTKKVLEWSIIKKDGNLFQFKTKEEALQAIADLEKYPIYHEVN